MTTAQPAEKEIYPSRSYRARPGECKFCDDHRDDPMMPPHMPSRFCESGKHNHCTCDTCF